MASAPWSSLYFWVLFFLILLGHHSLRLVPCWASPNKIDIVKALVFLVVMYRCDSWTMKKLSAEEWMLSNCGAREDSWESLGQQGHQLWIFIGRTDAETEAPILWPPDVKSWLIGKDPDAGKDWRQEEKGATEDETVGWHHQLNGHEFEQNPRDSEGQGNLACCSPWSRKESNTT